MSFNEETPLDDVVKYIKQASTSKTYSGIPIYIDPHGLKDADVTMASTVRHMDLEGIPLKTTLRLMLKQVGLAYCVRDGVLIISSPQAIFDELKEAQQELDTAKENEGEADEQPKRRNEPRARRGESLDQRRPFRGSLRVVAFGRGQLDHEGRALPGPGGDRDLSTVLADDLLCDGQAQTRSARALGRGE